MFFLHRYFSKFIASEFLYNRTLKIKRHWGIPYFYAIGIWSVRMIDFVGDNSHVLAENLFNILIILSLFIITLWYCHIIYSLEVPKKFHKKRKWK